MKSTWLLFIGFVNCGLLSDGLEALRLGEIKPSELELFGQQSVLSDGMTFVQVVAELLLKTELKKDVMSYCLEGLKNSEMAELVLDLVKKKSWPVDVVFEFLRDGIDRNVQTSAVDWMIDTLSQESFMQVSLYRSILFFVNRQSVELADNEFIEKWIRFVFTRLTTDIDKLELDFIVKLFSNDSHLTADNFKIVGIIETLAFYRIFPKESLDYFSLLITHSINSGGNNYLLSTMERLIQKGFNPTQFALLITLYSSILFLKRVWMQSGDEALRREYDIFVVEFVDTFRGNEEKRESVFVESFKEFLVTFDDEMRFVVLDVFGELLGKSLNDLPLEKRNPWTELRELFNEFRLDPNLAFAKIDLVVQTANSVVGRLMKNGWYLSDFEELLRQCHTWKLLEVLDKHLEWRWRSLPNFKEWNRLKDLYLIRVRNESKGKLTAVVEWKKESGDANSNFYLKTYLQDVMDANQGKMIRVKAKRPTEKHLI